MKKILLFTFFILILQISFSQQCEVKVDALKGDYIGNCVKGKADGPGAATGTDSYTGNFKKGLPDGKGKYTWQNGDTYEGYWKNGLFEGQGTLLRANANKIDSSLVISGFWKKGNYTGKYEKPFLLQTLTNGFSEASLRKTNSSPTDFTISAKSITGGGVSSSSQSGTASLPKVSLVDIQIIQGRFDREIIDESSSTITNKYTFHNVVYPLAAILTFRTVQKSFEMAVQKVNVEIYESANWYLQVVVEN